MPRKPLIKKLDLYGQVDVGTSDPSYGVQGQMFYNTTEPALKIYISGAWTAISGTAPTGGTFDFIGGTDFQFIGGTYFDFI
jgi:hypothetical protein